MQRRTYEGGAVLTRYSDDEGGDLVFDFTGQPPVAREVRAVDPGQELVLCTCRRWRPRRAVPHSPHLTASGLVDCGGRLITSTTTSPQ